MNASSEHDIDQCWQCQELLYGFLPATYEELLRESAVRRHARRSGERVCPVEWDGYEHEHLGDARCPYCGAQA